MYLNSSSVYLIDRRQLAYFHWPCSLRLFASPPERFTAVLNEQQQARADRERLRMRMLAADPFDAEAQRLIAEEIKQKNIDANMEAALEHNPESFGSVVMLYINCRVNGHPVKAFIDSGERG